MRKIIVMVLCALMIVGMSIPTESQAASKKWISAYKKIIKQNEKECRERRYAKWKTTYSLLYIDNDSIPELFVVNRDENDFENNERNLYSVHAGNVDSIHRGYMDSLYYNSKNGKIFVYHGLSEPVREDMYLLQKKGFSLKIEGEYSVGARGENLITVNHKINNKSVSRKKYLKVMDHTNFVELNEGEYTYSEIMRILKKKNKK